MSNELTTFTFTFTPTNTQVRVVTIDGEPWFVARDVAIILAYKNVDTSMTHILSPLGSDEKMWAPKNLSLARQPLLISERGLYKLVMWSNLPQARKFQDWVTREVLPIIRKDGMYVLGEEKVRTVEVSEDEFILRAYNLLRSKVERLKAEKEKLEAENTSMEEVIGAHMYTVARFCRTIPGINTNATKR